MITEFDEKGKLYTDVVLKKSVPCTIQTITHRIHGDVHVRPEERLLDEVIRSERFIAVTNASIYDTRGNRVYKTDFLTLNREQIIWLIPDDDLSSDFEAGGGS